MSCQATGQFGVVTTNEWVTFTGLMGPLAKRPGASPKLESCATPGQWLDYVGLHGGDDNITICGGYEKSQTVGLGAGHTGSSHELWVMNNFNYGSYYGFSVTRITPAS